MKADVRCEQGFEREAKIEGGVPRGDSAGEDSTHGKSGVKTARIALDEPGSDHSAQRMSPRDGAFRRADQLIEKIEHALDAVPSLDEDQRLLDRPAGGGVGGPGERKAARKHIGARNGVAYIFCGIGAARGDKTMAVKKQGAVPVWRNFDEIGGTVGQAAFVRGDTRLGRSIRRKGKPENCEG